MKQEESFEVKRLKQHWASRPLSWLLSAALVWPALLTLLAGGPRAQAQALTRSAQPLWAILDFENRSGYGGAEVGRTASDAFVVELGKSNKYDVLSRQETQKGLADTGQTVPLDVIGLQRLGRALGADAVATGEVAAISFSNNPRQATASVIIRVTDTRTGELVNGALAQGTSNPRAVSSTDDDELVNQAINNAAFAAVRQVVQFNLPKATVLINRDQDSVLLNKGTRDGISDGLNMVVTRNGTEVGRIRVSNASADQSDAVVTNRGLGIQPQDLATAIYRLPDFIVSHGVLNAKSNDVSSDGAGHGSKRNGFSGVTGILVALLAGALLLSLIRRGSSSGSLGGAAIGKPLAVSNRQDVVGGSGLPPGTDADIDLLYLGLTVPKPVDYLPISVRITATTGNIAPANFIEYHVYRTDFPRVLADAATLINTFGTNQQNVTVPFTFGQIPLLTQKSSQPLLLFDDGADKLGIAASKPLTGISAGNNGGGNNNNGGGGNNNGLQAIAISLTLPGTGIQHVGDRFQYLIEALYVQPATNGGGTLNPGNNNNSGGNTNNNNNNNGGNTNGGNTNGGGTGSGGHGTLYQLTGLSPTNFVTYLEPVIFTSASATSTLGSFATSTGPDNVVVSVPSTRSADDYILELSQSAGFEKKAVLTPDTTGPYSADVTAPRRGNPVTWFIRTGGKSKTLPELFPGATQIFARIGARDSRNGTANDKNPYVYSDPVAVPSGLVPNGSGVTTGTTTGTGTTGTGGTSGPPSPPVG